MLSRSAQGLYLMGRYLERAAHLCRLMQLQVETLVDRPLRGNSLWQEPGQPQLEPGAARGHP